MRRILLAHEADFDGWRNAARALASHDVAPEAVIWQVGGEQDLFAPGVPRPREDAAFSVPRRFVDLAELAVCHRDPERFTLLYRLLCRLRSQPRLIEDRADPLVDRIETMARAVARDIHAMRRLLRFHEVVDAGGTWHVAWFEPEHHILVYGARFFAEGFADRRWSILTPDLCIHHDGGKLAFAPGTPRPDAPQGAMAEAAWRNLAETSLVPLSIAPTSTSTRRNAVLDQEADAMAGKMQDANAAEVPESLAAIRESAKSCTRCDLYRDATQTVFGIGPGTARIMFVGEAPGDQEDLQGKPFVGPAGQVFNRALAQAGIDRSDAYITNAVKHFKFIWRGKRRLHQKPDGPEIDACRFWLEHERALMRPQITVALGATAARALLGKVVTIAKTRGQPIHLADGSECWVTVHPSFLLRIEDRDAAQIEYDRFVQDLITVRDRLTALNAVA